MTPPLPVDPAFTGIDPFDLSPGAKIAAPPTMVKRLSRFAAPVIALLLMGAIAYVWFAPTSASTSSPPLSGISQQSFGNTSSGSSDTSGGGGDLHVYVVGAVKHPGVYELPAGARVYQLIVAAGGALPNANLVALNMAATLTDGQEVYVITNGEIPPTYQGGVPGPGSGGASGTVTAGGQLININTASADEMRSALHISSTTAQNIVNYRTQHGPFTSVDQLLQVVSKSIYDKIKDEVTV
jgi:competence protein ComEA